MEPQQEKYSPVEFAQAMRQEYPGAFDDDKNDYDLAKAIIEEHPEMSDMVHFGPMSEIRKTPGDSSGHSEWEQQNPIKAGIENVGESISSSLPMKAVGAAWQGAAELGDTLAEKEIPPFNQAKAITEGIKQYVVPKMEKQADFYRGQVKETVGPPQLNPNMFIPFSEDTSDKSQTKEEHKKWEQEHPVVNKINKFIRDNWDNTRPVEQLVGKYQQLNQSLDNIKNSYLGLVTDMAKDQLPTDIPSLALTATMGPRGKGVPRTLDADALAARARGIPQTAAMTTGSSYTKSWEKMLRGLSSDTLDRTLKEIGLKDKVESVASDIAEVRPELQSMKAGIDPLAESTASSAVKGVTRGNTIIIELERVLAPLKEKFNQVYERIGEKGKEVPAGDSVKQIAQEWYGGAYKDLPPIENLRSIVEKISKKQSSNPIGYLAKEGIGEESKIGKGAVTVKDLVDLHKDLNGEIYSYKYSGAALDGLIRLRELVRGGLETAAPKISESLKKTNTLYHRFAENVRTKHISGITDELVTKKRTDQAFKLAVDNPSVWADIERNFPEAADEIRKEGVRRYAKMIEQMPAGKAYEKVQEIFGKQEFQYLTPAQEKMVGRMAAIQDTIKTSEKTLSDTLEEIKGGKRVGEEGKIMLDRPGEGLPKKAWNLASVAAIVLGGPLWKTLGVIKLMQNNGPEALARYYLSHTAEMEKAFLNEGKQSTASHFSQVSTGLALKGLFKKPEDKKK